MSEPKTGVPKFGSFRPKPTTPLPKQVDVKDKCDKASNRSSREENKSHQGRHRSHISDRKDRRRETSRDRQSGKQGPPIEASHSPPPQEEAVGFFIDRKGDVQNLQYGSIHRYSVRSFHRAGAGSIIGLPSYMRIDRDYGDEKGILIMDRRASKANHKEKYIFSKIEKERPRLLKIRHEIGQEDSAIEEMDFVPLQKRGKKRKRDTDGESSGSENGGYRSIHGIAKARNEPEDKSFRYATDSESTGSETGRAIRLDLSTRQKTVELSRKVEQFPHDIPAWLALIEHQDTLIRTKGDQRRITNAEIRSTADIKIHMYEKAFEKARSVGDRETLRLGLMSEGAKIWEVKTQSEKWEQIVTEDIDSLVLWKRYLEFKQTAFGTFQYEDIRDIFVKRIKLLLQVVEIDPSNALHHQLVYVLLRLTTFIREAGYAELAVAIWQGLLEFNFFSPSKSLPLPQKIELFKKFWESEVPRIGEDVALGWAHFVDNEGASEAPDPLNDKEGNLLEDRNLFKSWANAEHTRSRVSRVPARTMDEVVEDDPYRVILASDIEDFLISFESDWLKKALIEAFLLFCRLPPLDKTSREWSSDPFLAETLLECDPAWVRRHCLPPNDQSSEERQIDISSTFESPSMNIQSCPESMFSAYWFKSIRSWREIYGGDNGPVQYKWLRNSLKQLLQAHFTEDLAEYYLAFEWRNEPESIKRVSKGLLKQRPSSVRLYNAYAMIEWSRENRDIAKNIFSAAIDMRQSMPDHDRDAAVLLWKSWIWACLEAMDHEAALSHLLSMESSSQRDEISPSPFQILKTRQYLEQRRDYHLYARGQLQYAILFAESLALLSYLTSKSGSKTECSAQRNIADALAVYDTFSHTLMKTLVDRKIIDNSSHELSLQSAARLLHHHTRTGPFRPALLRKSLANYLTLFPHNTVFLSLYTFNEARLRIDNRVRSILSSTVLTPLNDILTSRLFAIYYEMHHGTIHSVRSAFEHALSTQSKSSAGLWRLYLLYCLQTSQFRSHIKEIWYRALRACPWAEELFILGFEMSSDSGMEFTELKSVWRVMGEKGLRVHVDLEDKFETMKALDRSDRKQIAHI